MRIGASALPGLEVFSGPLSVVFPGFYPSLIGYDSFTCGQDLQLFASQVKVLYSSSISSFISLISLLRDRPSSFWHSLRLFQSCGSSHRILPRVSSGLILLAMRCGLFVVCLENRFEFFWVFGLDGLF